MPQSNTLITTSKKKGNIMLHDLVSKYRSWKKYRETYDELARMSSRELNDIGISRADIGSIARQVMR